MADTISDLKDPPSPPPLGAIQIPPELEAAIFKRFWIWLGALSAIIIALSGFVWAFSVSELKEYAKDVSDNRAYEEWSKIRTEISDEMRRLRDDLSKTTDAVNKAVQDSRERVGETNEVSKSAHKIADDVEVQLKQLQGSVRSAGEIFAAKTTLEEAINKEVNSPSFQEKFGARIDGMQKQFGGDTNTLQKRIVDIEQKVDALKAWPTATQLQYGNASEPDTMGQQLATGIHAECPSGQYMTGLRTVMNRSNSTISGFAVGCNSLVPQN
jgi:hypothetical protein